MGVSAGIVPILLGVLSFVIALVYLRIRASRRVSLGAHSKKRFKCDATAFLPNEFRSEQPELLQVLLHRPHKARAARKLALSTDAKTEKAASQTLGKITNEAIISVQVHCIGGKVESSNIPQTWRGQTLQFGFLITPSAQQKHCYIEIRVFVDGAQLGAMLISRAVTEQPKGELEAVSMEPTRSVFVSYSSQDLEQVSIVAGAYERIGVPYFLDRTSLRSGEEYPNRLLEEIEAADLFHLCWSQSASQSKWVLQEVYHALETRQKSTDLQPKITIQMFDGPPWAKHPEDLNQLNFDDFIRAAVSAYVAAKKK